MTVGFIMLVHTDFDRAAQVARHWASHACPVVIHVDRRVVKAEFDAFAAALADLRNIRFCARRRCEWGTWSLVAASQDAAVMMLQEFPAVRHVFLSSGACLPLRPVAELKAYLAERPNTNFIESVTIEDVPWTVGGLDDERFTLSFPFSWKRQRLFFDLWVRAQRLVGRARMMPSNLVPHLGSQWWCLTRQTLAAILNSPNRGRHDRFFSKVWIPDESYFQTLVRVYSNDVESRSLTLSKFDFQGKPHMFYDDHLQLLRRSDCFVARKIWPRANLIYESFLAPDDNAMRMAEPNPGKIDRVFSKAVEKRTRGRAGLYMHSRFPNWDWENGKTSSPYSVFVGFSDLFEDFETWLPRNAETYAHGHLFAPDRVEFAERQRVFAGGLSDSPALRDYNAKAFLTNLVWNTRGERQSFQFGPSDNQALARFAAFDSNAQISVISGAWAIPLFFQNRSFAELRRDAARLQKAEAAYLKIFRLPETRARVRIWSLADFIDMPMEHLQVIIDEIGARAPHRLTEAPRMVDLSGFNGFLQALKNHGMHLYLVGDMPDGDPNHPQDRPRDKPYLVQ